MIHSNPAPQIATTDSEIASCFDVLAELRPHIRHDTFVQAVRDMQQQGYQLAFISADGMVVAAAGFHISSSFYMGKKLYVDDLVTTATGRSKGYGRALISWLRELAIAEECRFLHLDSGTQRGDAHRFYFREGFTIVAYHFAEQLTP